MYGVDINALNVYSKRSDEGGFGTLIWTNSGNQGNEWFKASVTLNETDPFQVGILLIAMQNNNRQINIFVFLQITPVMVDPCLRHVH